MFFTSSNIGRCKLMVATALMFGMLTTVSHAYTLEQEQMCSGDAMRLCSSEIPDVDRITDGCKAVFEVETPAAATESPVTEIPAARPSRPINLTPKFKHG
jgi:hypothetical protein